MANPASRPDALRVDTSGKPSQLPDRSSMSPSLSLLSMPAVSPEPAYIAAAAAANVVTSEIINEYHISFPSDSEHEGASVTSGSLSLINAFLDRLLFNFLSCAHSTSLASLRPAVTEVLRPRLAKEAIGGADEELQEYLGGDIEELNTFHGGEEPSGDWDLDLVWKRTRLRCMLYTRLGDMEEEDEEMYLEQENLNPDRSSKRDGGMVSPAVAIFLTSVLEFVGEHALMIAAQAAYKRHETRARIEESGLQKVTVEETDMEKVALNSTLGRLWRAWRASMRSPRGSLSRISGLGSRGYRGFSVGSRSSLGTSDNFQDDLDRVPSVAEVLGGPDPSSIPLPSTDHDVEEIEVPGYTANLSQRQRKGVDEGARPISMFVRTDMDRSSRTSRLEAVASSDEESTPRQEYAANRTRPRAQSLPIPETPFLTPSAFSGSDAPFLTPEREFPPTQDIHNRSIIDMSGNSAAEFGDYAIPKSSSAPTSPYQGSEFNATLHIAHEYESQPRESYIDYQSETDPADGFLKLTRDDYKIDDSEHAALNAGNGHSPQGLQPPYEQEPAVSPLVGGVTPGSGRVSPVGQASIASGEVSPIDSSDDEREIYIEPNPLEDAPRKAQPVSATPVVPQQEVVQAAPKHVPTREPDTGVQQKFVQQKHVTGESAKLRERDSPISENTPRATQGRHRAKAGATEGDHVKEQYREAYVIPKNFDISNQLPDSSSLSRRPIPPEIDSERKHRTETGSAGRLPVRGSEQKAEIPDKSLISPSQLARKAVPPNGSNSKSVPSVQNTDQHRQLPAPPAERISVQRGSATIVDTRDPTSGRVSEASIREPAIPTKSRNRVASAAREQPRESAPSRTSSDLNKGIADGRSSTSSSDHAKNFDQLIKSGETLQYTLTPQNMREIEERGSPIQQKPSTPVPAQVRSRGTSIADRPSPKQPRSAGPSPGSMNGLSSHPVANKSVEEPPDFVIRAGPAIKRGPQLIAKDARMESTNTSDLKDFFRSTGPDLVDPRAARAIPQPAKAGPKAARKPPVVAPPIVAPPPKSSKPKLKYQPREATRQGNDTSSLAEFFRNGPPGAHRVPDSDDVTVKPRDAQSIASTQDSFITRSVQSSTNSRTGLLESSRNNGGKVSAWEKRVPPSDEGMGPVRKQRRVKDPYAIDTDSEDEDAIASTPRGGRNEDNEESLLDFLRSEPPPGASMSPPPLQVASPPPKTLQRKPSGPSMRSRFALSGSKGNSKQTANKKQPQSESGLRGGPTGSGPPTANDPHLYSRPPNNYGTYGNDPSVRPRQASLGATGNPTGRITSVRAARKQARDSVNNTNSVRELADFLRNTEPPPAPIPLPLTPPKEEGGFSRMFSRRKKAAVS